MAHDSSDRKGPDRCPYCGAADTFETVVDGRSGPMSLHNLAGVTGGPLPNRWRVDRCSRCGFTAWLDRGEQAA